MKMLLLEDLSGIGWPFDKRVPMKQLLGQYNILSNQRFQMVLAGNQERALCGAQWQVHRSYSDHIRESNELLTEQVPSCDYEGVPPPIEKEESLKEKMIDFSYALSHL